MPSHRLRRGALRFIGPPQRWPQVLPGGAGVLFSEHSSTGGWDAANIVVMPLQGGAPKVVVRGGYFGRYLAAPKRSGSAVEGYLLYMQQGTVFGVPFDPTRLETTGQAVPVVDGVAANSTTGGVQLDCASDGTLVYVPGTAATSSNPIGWVTRDGKTSPLRAAKADWNNVRFSPDGQKVAMDISDGKQRDIWVYEWSRDTLTQLTFDPNDDTFPLWTPDGRWIAYMSNEHAGVYDIFVRPFPGPGGPWRVSMDGAAFPRWSKTASELLFYSNGNILFAPFTVAGDSFRADKPQVWTPAAVRIFGTQYPYDIHPDGKRLAAIASPDQNEIKADKVVFVFNFIDYLKNTVPAGKR